MPAPSPSDLLAQVGYERVKYSPAAIHQMESELHDSILHRRVAKTRFGQGHSGDGSNFNRADPNVPMSEANLVTSIWDGSESDDPTTTTHMPVFDFDLPIAVWPSSTPDHYHLFINKEISWTDYEKLLKVMKEVGLLDANWVDYTLQRRYGNLRLPNIRKPPDSSPRPVVTLPRPARHRNEMWRFAVEYYAATEDAPLDEVSPVSESVGPLVTAPPDVHAEDAVEGIRRPLDSGVEVGVSHDEGRALANSPVEGGILSGGARTVFIEDAIDDVLEPPPPTPGTP